MGRRACRRRTGPLRLQAVRSCDRPRHDADQMIDGFATSTPASFGRSMLERFVPPPQENFSKRWRWWCPTPRCGYLRRNPTAWGTSPNRRAGASASCVLDHQPLLPDARHTQPLVGRARLGECGDALRPCSRIAAPSTLRLRSANAGTHREHGDGRRARHAPAIVSNGRAARSGARRVQLVAAGSAPARSASRRSRRAGACTMGSRRTSGRVDDVEAVPRAHAVSLNSHALGLGSCASPC
jgi:hypothetical protein